MQPRYNQSSMSSLSCHFIADVEVEWPYWNTWKPPNCNYNIEVGQCLSSSAGHSNINWENFKAIDRRNYQVRCTHHVLYLFAGLIGSMSCSSLTWHFQLSTRRKSTVMSCSSQRDRFSDAIIYPHSQRFGFPSHLRCTLQASYQGRITYI